MAQQYYEYVNYKDDHVHEQKKLPKGACHRYIIVFHSVFHLIFNVSRPFSGLFVFVYHYHFVPKMQTNRFGFMPSSLLSPQLSFVFAEFPMLFVLNDYLDTNKHILFGVKACGKDTTRTAAIADISC